MRDNLLRKCARYCRIQRRISHCKNLLTDLRPKLLILAYHRILPSVNFNPLNTIISSGAFIRQIDILARKFPIISLEEALSQHQSGQVKTKIQIVLTFDDGYRDNYEVVFPILSRKGLPATFFVVTDYIGSDAPLWDWEIIARSGAYRDIDNIQAKGHIFSRRTNESQSSFAYRIFEEMKSADIDAIRGVIDILRDRAKGRLNAYDFRNDSCMNWPQVRAMSEAGMEIGAHGLTHRSLARMPLVQAEDEIKKSKSVIESNIKRECLHFAFPFGSKRDYNQTLIDNVKGAGFQSCLLNVHGYNHMDTDPFCFKRIIMEETTDLRYLLG